MFVMIALFGSEVVAGDIDSLRLFYTPEERQARAGINKSVDVGEHSGSKPTINSASPSRTERISTNISPHNKRHADTAALNSASVEFNALMFSDAGVRVLLNGLPCSRVEHQHEELGFEPWSDLKCPHLDNFKFHFRLQLSDLKILVLNKGRSIGVLSVGKSL